MKKPFLIKGCILLFIVLRSTSSCAQNPENWTSKQLIEPAALANDLNGAKELPLLISVGPGAIILGSVAAGMAGNKDGLDKLKAQLDTLSKNKKIVVYCGCCPFEHCPNVRPAIALLKEMNFINYYLLDLPHNIKQDWIDKGYPTAKQ